MAIVTVDTDAISDSAASITASAERIRAEVQSLRNGLERLQASWQGAASESFRTVLEEWARTQATVEGSLNSIGATLGGAGMAYSEVEGENARRFAF